MLFRKRGGDPAEAAPCPSTAPPPTTSLHVGDRFVPSWPDPENPDTYVPLTATTLYEALHTEWPDDAHAVGYVVEGDDTQPRLNVKYQAVQRLRAEGQDVLMRVLFVDFDNVPHEPWPSAEAAKDAVDVLGALFPEAAVYATRSGLRAVWHLRTPVPTENWRSFASNFLAATVRPRVREVFGGELDVDDVSREWSRMFRLPYVVRDGVPTKPSTYLRVPSPWPALDLRRSPLDLAEAGREVERAALAAPTPAGPTPDEPPEVATAIFLDALGEDFKRAVDVRFPGLFDALHAGRAFFAPGERNNATFRAVAVLYEAITASAGAVPEPETVFGLFRDSISATSGQTPVPEALDETWDMVVRRHDIERRRYEEERERLAVAEQRLAATRLPPLAYLNSTYYVLDADAEPLRYCPPVSNAAAVPPLLEQRCACLGVNPRGTKGTYMPMSEIIGRFGKQVADVVLRLGHSEVSFDPRTQILRVGVAPPADVEPVYHDDVATWLRLLTDDGEDREAILDWLATARRLDRTSCALYLEGPGGAGKGMFASGVASLWASPATTFQEAVGTYAFGITKNPVVFLDEGGIKGSNEAVSATFRSLVGETRRRVEEKYMAKVSVEGALRVIIAANGPDALPMPDAKTRDDVDAITSRIRHIRVSQAAADFLVAIGGADATTKASWVSRPDGSPGRIAQHILWLEQNHTPRQYPGARFLVPGRKTEWHRRFMLSDDRAELLAVVGAALSKGDFSVVAAYDDESDTVWVHQAALARVWPKLSNGTFAPPPSTLAKALSAVCRSRGVKRYLGGKQQRCYGIDPDALIEGADNAGSPYTDRLRDIFGRPAVP